jgi:Glyoxalase/Bleomycin resistance protein/Dioxygenase superfamily
MLDVDQRQRPGQEEPCPLSGQSELAMGRSLASITIETDDCRKAVEELKSRGVEFVSDVLELPWGYVAQFQDPDGNRLRDGVSSRWGRCPPALLLLTPLRVA